MPQLLPLVQILAIFLDGINYKLDQVFYVNGKYLWTTPTTPVSTWKLPLLSFIYPKDINYPLTIPVRIVGEQLDTLVGQLGDKLQLREIICGQGYLGDRNLQGLIEFQRFAWWPKGKLAAQKRGFRQQNLLLGF